MHLSCLARPRRSFEGDKVGLHLHRADSHRQQLICRLPILEHNPLRLRPLHIGVPVADRLRCWPRELLGLRRTLPVAANCPEPVLANDRFSQPKEKTAHAKTSLRSVAPQKWSGSDSRSASSLAQRRSSTAPLQTPLQQTKQSVCLRKHSISMQRSVDK